MSFRMRCPKCHSSNLDLEEDQRAFLGGGRHQVLLHCYTCGMILYGEARIQEEFDRQKVEWEKQQKEQEERAARARAVRAARTAARPRPKPRVAVEVPAPPVEAPAAAAAPEPTPAPEPTSATAPAKAAVEPNTPSAPEGETAPVVAEEAPGAEPKAKPKAKTRSKAKAKVAAAAEPAAPTADQPQCAWKSCEKVARPNSKYCSRNCSNKNARARHAARKKTPTSEADAS